MSERSVQSFFTDLIGDFQEFVVKVRRGEELNAVIFGADGARLFRTCRSVDDLAQLVCDAADDLFNVVEAREERLNEAREALQRHLNPEDVSESGGWEEAEAQSEIIAALEDEVAALRRQLTAQRAVNTRLRNQLRD